MSESEPLNARDAHRSGRRAAAAALLTTPDKAESERHEDLVNEAKAAFAAGHTEAWLTGALNQLGECENDPVYSPRTNAHRLGRVAVEASLDWNASQRQREKPEDEGYAYPGNMAHFVCTEAADPHNPKRAGDVALLLRGIRERATEHEPAEQYLAGMTYAFNVTNVDGEKPSRVYAKGSGGAPARAFETELEILRQRRDPETFKLRAEAMERVDEMLEPHAALTPAIGGRSDPIALHQLMAENAAKAGEPYLEPYNAMADVCVYACQTLSRKGPGNPYAIDSSDGVVVTRRDTTERIVEPLMDTIWRERPEVMTGRSTVRGDSLLHEVAAAATTRGDPGMEVMTQALKRHLLPGVLDRMQRGKNDDGYTPEELHYRTLAPMQHSKGRSAQQSAHER